MSPCRTSKKRSDIDDPLEFHSGVFRMFRNELFDGPVGLLAVGAGRKMEIGNFFHEQNLLSVIRYNYYITGAVCRSCRRKGDRDEDLF